VLPRGLRRGVLEPVLARLPASTERVSLDYRARRFLAALDQGPLARHHGFKAIHTAASKRTLLAHPVAADVDPLDRLRPAWDEAAGLGPIGRLQHVDAVTYLVDDLLTKTDRASMAHSLEARVPFVDDRVLEFAAQVPDTLGVAACGRSGSASLRGRLAAARGRARPQARLLDPGGGLASGRRPRPRGRPARPRRGGSPGRLPPEAVARLVQEHAAGRVDHSRPLWGLLMFGLWFRHVHEARS
jgi:asparagine synthase (glutamine-hydrolysing)